MSPDLRKMHSSRIGFRVILFPMMSNKNLLSQIRYRYSVCARESMIETSCSSRNVQPEFHVVESEYDIRDITI